MNYRTLGRTGIRVSEVGVGGHQDKAPKETLPPGQRASYTTEFDGLIHEMSHQDPRQNHRPRAGPGDQLLRHVAGP